MTTAFEYAVIIHTADEGGFWSEVPALPGAGAQGETMEEVIAETTSSIQAVLEVMRSRGESVSPPTDVVVTVRVAA